MNSLIISDSLKQVTIIEIIKFLFKINLLFTLI